MKIINLFNGPFHNMLSEQGKKEIHKEYTDWMKEIFTFFICGMILGIIIGVFL